MKNNLFSFEYKGNVYKLTNSHLKNSNLVILLGKLTNTLVEELKLFLRIALKNIQIVEIIHIIII